MGKKVFWSLIIVSLLIIGVFLFTKLKSQNEIVKSEGEKTNSREILNNNFPNEHLEKSIINYLLNQKQFSWKTKPASHHFCTVENLNSEKELFPFYVWAYCGEYFMENGKLKNLSGFSGPIKINYPNELSFYDINKFSHEAPRDGSSYSEDIRKIFPESVQPKIFNFARNEIMKENEQLARFHIISQSKMRQYQN